MQTRDPHHQTPPNPNKVVSTGKTPKLPEPVFSLNARDTHPSPVQKLRENQRSVRLLISYLGAKGVFCAQIESRPADKLRQIC